MDDVAITIQHVFKDFKLPHERRDSLKERVLSFKKPTFDAFHALRDINLDIKRGEFFGIVGRNGSGKSTLLKIIAGIYQPTKGDVRINGTLTPFIELGIGFNPELTGRENVYLNGAILGLTRKEVHAKYQEIVDFAELHKFMDQKLKNYSSGMQVRLAFSIAMQAHNDILLIDEVLAVGDTNFQRKCYEKFQEIKKSGRTVVFVTHDMGAVQEYCDRAMMIQDSRVVEIGQPREVALRYEVANISQDRTTLGASQRPKNDIAHLVDIRVRGTTKRTQQFGLDDDIVVEVDIKVEQSEPLQCNVFLVRPDGRYLAGYNTTGDLGKFTPKPGKHTLTWVIKKGQLPKGDYTVNTALYTYGDWPHGGPPTMLDILDTSYGFNTPLITLLESSNLQNGDFYMQGHWSQKH